MSIIFIISLHTNKILWIKPLYCWNEGWYEIENIKISDTLYIIGSCKGLIMAIDSSLNAKWIVRPDTIDTIFFGLFPDIKRMLKLNDSLIAIATNVWGIWGIFNIKTKSFVWTKYDLNFNPAVALAFDGSNLMVGLKYSFASTYFSILKVDLNGTILWVKNITLEEYYLHEFIVRDILFDGQNYVYLIKGTIANPNPYGDDWRFTTILKLDTAGNLIWIKNYNIGNNFFKLLKDSDGYVAVGYICSVSRNCEQIDNDNILIFKIDFDGNVKFLKSYSSNVAGWSSEDRAYNIAFDYDRNYLVSGFIRASSNSSYPIVLKINRDNGDLIWARVWNTPPPNTSLNEARGVISIGQGKFYLLTFIPGGIAVIKEDTSSLIQCTRNINFNVSSLGVSSSYFTLVSYQYGFQGGTFSFPWIYINAFLTEGCSITSNYEFYKSCLFKISSNKGYIQIELNKKENVSIYDISGRIVYNEFFEGKKQIKVKKGIYIIRIGDEKVRIIVR